MKEFTEQEQEIMYKITQIHNMYVNLENIHPIDLSDWNKIMHKLEKIMKRRKLRGDFEYPSYY